MPLLLYILYFSALNTLDSKDFGDKNQNMYTSSTILLETQLSPSFDGVLIVWVFLQESLLSVCARTVHRRTDDVWVQGGSTPTGGCHKIGT